jgi:hypothetical protein
LAIVASPPPLPFDPSTHQALGHALLSRVWPGPSSIGDGMPLPRMSPLADAGALCMVGPCHFNMPRQILTYLVTCVPMLALTHRSEPPSWPHRSQSCHSFAPTNRQVRAPQRNSSHWWLAWRVSLAPYSLQARLCTTGHQFGVSAAVSHLATVDGTLGGKARRMGRSLIICSYELVLISTS